MKQKLIYLEENLCSFKPLSPNFKGGKGEYQKAEWLKNYLTQKKLGKITEYNTSDERAEKKIRPNFNLFYKGQTDQNLWIISHLDVVPANDTDKWNSNPFKLKIVGNKLYARGVFDNNGGLCASVLALESLKEKNKKPYFNVNLLFISDEECGNKYGMKYLLDNFTLFKKNDLIIVPDAGDQNGLRINIAEKSPLWLKFTITGKESHGSKPDKGINAAKAAAYFTVELDKLNKIFSSKDDLFSTGSTFEPTKKLANTENINAIPGIDVFFMDCRLLPSINSEEVLKEIDKMTKTIEEKTGVKIKREIAMHEPIAPATPKNAQIVKILTESIQKTKNKEPYLKGMGGGTFASLLRKKGLEVAVYCTTNDSLHCANEYCEMDKVIEDSKVFERVMSNNE